MSQVLCRKFGGEDVRFNLVLELVEAAAKRAVASGYRAQRLGQAGTQTFSFQRWMPPFDFAVRLQRERRGPDMGHAADPDELLEVAGDELRAIVGNDPRCGLGKLLPRPLQDDLDFRLGHPRANLSVHQVAAVAISHAAQVVERPGQVQVGDVYMPVLVRSRRLLETLSLARRLAVPVSQSARLVQHTPDAGRAYRHNVGIQHPEGQPPVAFQGIPVVEIQDRPLLLGLQPEVARSPAVVLVHPPVARPPVVELAGSHAQPAYTLLRGDRRPLVPAAYEVDHLVARVVGYPLAPQISPRLF